MSLPRRPRHTTHARPIFTSLFTRARHAIRRSPLWKASSGIIAAALAIGMVAVGVAMPASAHDNVVTGTVACSTSGSGWVVTWKVTNDWDQNATIASTSPVLVGAAGTVINAASNRNDSSTYNSKTFTQNVTALPSALGLTLDVVADWTDGTHRTNSGTIAQSAFTGCTPPPACVDTASYNYTYAASDNSGTIDVTGDTCGKALYVWATSWKYTKSTSIWPQTIDQVSKLVIDKAGHYVFKQTPTCGQGDIYASWTDNINPAAKSPLTGPSAWEKFLSTSTGDGGVGITGTGAPTYMNQALGCVTIPTQTVTSSDFQCGVTGTIVLPPVTGIAYKAYLGSTATGTSYPVSGTIYATNDWKATGTALTGDVTITAVKSGTKDLTGTQSWTFTFHPKSAQDCATLPPNGNESIPTYRVDCSLVLTTTTTPYTWGYVWDATTGAYVQGPKTAGTPVVTTKTVTLDELKTLGIDAPTCLVKAAADPTDGMCGPDDETLISGFITVDMKSNVSYSIVGQGININPVTTPETNVTAGDYVVTATAVAPYTIDGQSTWNLKVKDGSCLPTLAPIATAAVGNDQTCSPSGTLSGGSITVGHIVDSTGEYDSFNAGVTYFIDGVKVTSQTTPKSAGTYHVTATLDNPADTIDGLDSWFITIGAAAQACGQLTTLPFTGVSGNPIGLLMVALLLLLAGTGVYTGSRLKPRTKS